MKTKCLATVVIICTGVLAMCGVARAQMKSNVQTTSPTIALAMNTQLTVVEKQIVPAAEAMPAERYFFAPTDGDFKGTRTFALEVRHIAAANFALFSAILGQAPPPGVSFSGSTNGPDDLATKDQIVKFLKDSFALGHRAIATITARNAVTPLAGPTLPFRQPYANSRLALATFAISHALDHYGQMVVYLRMNGFVPPASQGQSPANPSAK